MPTTKPTTPVLLSQAQRDVLSAAAQRPEGALILPARLKGKAAQNLAQALLDKGLVREIRTRGDLPVWRKDASTGRSFTLVLIKAGRALVAGQPDGAAAPPEPAASPAPASTAPRSCGLPRAGSKLAEVVTLLRRDQGSSVTELMAATGWLPHTTRAALTGLRKRGYDVSRQAGEGGAVYRIERTAAAA